MTKTAAMLTTSIEGLKEDVMAVKADLQLKVGDVKADLQKYVGDVKADLQKSMKDSEERMQKSTADSEERLLAAIFAAGSTKKKKAKENE